MTDDQQQQLTVGVDQEQDEEIALPVVELLTGRGFITGKSGSGKSNTASVVAEKLLNSAFGLLIVDVDGEYYGLKEEYEILHAGADEECDIVVSPEHAEKLATLALEQNVPIILDVSGYLEESVANELLLAVTKHLFAKEKRLKKPFLLVVEECHEYIPEGGGMNETGKMLIKVGKRGRKHGLGIVGISQRPADVKKDFITQCDWLCWHRLTWDNDTKVVGRILGSTYASAVEELGDGEAFLMTDWDESIRRIQFHRKQTFDAGATPGLDDFERPELKSVSDDLVGDLQAISETEARRESTIADLRQELEKRDQRVRQLEDELEEARDLSAMADQFAQALLGKADASYRGGAGGSVATRKRDTQAGLDEYEYEYGPGEGTAAGDEADGLGGETDGADGTDGADTETNRPATDTPTPGAKADNDGVDENETTIDPVTRTDITAEALRFDEAIELGTREAVIDELSKRVERLPTLAREMLVHYRHEEVSEPVAAHIDAGGDGDMEHAYSRNRPIRQAGLIRHIGRGQYAYAIPDLIREAYADRLEDKAVETMVHAVETTFVSSQSQSRSEDATDAVSALAGETEGGGGGGGGGGDGGDGGDDGGGGGSGEGDDSTDNDAGDDGEGGGDDGHNDDDTMPAATDGLSEAARRFARRGEK